MTVQGTKTCAQTHPNSYEPLFTSVYCMSENTSLFKPVSISHFPLPKLQDQVWTLVFIKVTLTTTCGLKKTKLNYQLPVRYNFSELNYTININKRWIMMAIFFKLVFICLVVLF